MENKFMTSLIKGSNSALAGQTAHARLAEWTARKVQWRKESAEGKAAEVLKPQQNDRPEVTGKPPQAFDASIKRYQLNS